MSYVPPPPPPPAVTAPSNPSPSQAQNQFVSVPTTPIPQPQPYYEDITLHSQSSYSIKTDNYQFWLQQCWRIRLGFRLIILIVSIGVVSAATYVVTVYYETKRHTSGMWRDRQGMGGIDMSPVDVLLGVGVGVLVCNGVLVLGSLIPAIGHMNNLSDIISLSLSSLSLIASITAIVYTFHHPSMSVDFDSPTPISFSKYACNIGPRVLQVAEEKQATGNPLGGVDGRAIVLFRGMCGQFNLSWVLLVIVIAFEVFVLASIPLGVKWRKGLEQVEREEDEFVMNEKYRRM